MEEGLAAPRSKQGPICQDMWVIRGGGLVDGEATGTNPAGFVLGCRFPDSYRTAITMKPPRRTANSLHMRMAPEGRARNPLMRPRKPPSPKNRPAVEKTMVRMPRTSNVVGKRLPEAAPMRAAPRTSLPMTTRTNRGRVGSERKRTNTVGRKTLRTPIPINAQPTTATYTLMSSSSPPHSGRPSRRP